MLAFMVKVRVRVGMRVGVRDRVWQRVWDAGRDKTPVTGIVVRCFILHVKCWAFWSYLPHSTVTTKPRHIAGICVETLL